MNLLIAIVFACGVCHPDAAKCSACKSCLDCKACSVEGKVCSVKREIARAEKARARPDVYREIFRWIIGK